MSEPNTEQLTKGKILAMEAKGLKRLVAEHVMGCHIYHYDKDVEENCYYMLVDGDGNFSDIERKTEEEAWGDCPNYGEDISAAWEVVEKIKGELQDVTIHDDPYQGCKVTISLISWAKAKTVPEAICKAALLAVMGL